MGRWISAKQDGRCRHCGKPFEAGSEIWFRSAGVVYCAECGLVDENTPHEAGPYELSVMKDLAKFPVEASEGVYAQNMVGLAKDLDQGDVPPRERPNYTKEIRLNLISLRDEFPVEAEQDETDEARKRRERRAREAGGF